MNERVVSNEGKKKHLGVGSNLVPDSFLKGVSTKITYLAFTWTSVFCCTSFASTQNFDLVSLDLH